SRAVGRARSARARVARGRCAVTLSRRELFGLLRRPAAEPETPARAPGDEDEDGTSSAAAPPVTPASGPPSAGSASPEPGPPIATADAPSTETFSLDAFYAARSPERVLPPFAIRAEAAI